MTSNAESRSRMSPLRSHWPLALTCTVIGLIVGLFAALVMPSRYTAEARLAVGPDSNSAYAIAGYPIAARELAANYARWVQNGAQDGTWSVEGATSVAASPIPETGVIRVEVTSASEEQAVAGANTVSDKLKTMVTDLQRDADPRRAYRTYEQLAPQVAAAQNAYDTARGAARATAHAELLKLQLSLDANADLYRRLYADTQGISQLSVIVPAASMGSDRGARLQQFAVLGTLGGFLVGWLLATRRARRSERQGGLSTRASAVADDPHGSDLVTSPSGSSWSPTRPQ